MEIVLKSSRMRCLLFLVCYQIVISSTTVLYMSFKFMKLSNIISNLKYFYVFRGNHFSSRHWRCRSWIYTNTDKYRKQISMHFCLWSNWLWTVFYLKKLFAYVSLNNKKNLNCVCLFSYNIHISSQGFYLISLWNLV